MKISIVTATYNSGATVRDTMESVLRQTYTQIEHIIVDGGSSDNTMEIVRELEPLYGGRLRYVSEPPNLPMRKPTLSTVTCITSTAQT